MLSTLPTTTIPQHPFVANVVPTTIQEQRQRILGQSLLITGSAVGAGLLALPSVTYKMGLQYSLVCLVLACAYMACMACLLIEIASYCSRRHHLSNTSTNNMHKTDANHDTEDLHDHEDTIREPTSPKINLSEMSKQILGPIGQTLTILFYCIVYSATFTAYLAQGGKLVFQCFQWMSSFNSNTLAFVTTKQEEEEHTTAVAASTLEFLSQIIFIVVSGYIIYKGPKVVEKVNSICMVGAILSFGSLVQIIMTTTTTTTTSNGSRTLASPTNNNSQQLSESILEDDDWGTILSHALPVMIVAFSYHNMIPSVYHSFSYQKTKSSTLSILLGSGVALGMYSIWQMVVFQSFSSSNQPQQTTVALSSPRVEDTTTTTVTTTTANILDNLQKQAPVSLLLFFLFSLLTSILGVGLGCIDFTMDLLLFESTSVTTTKTTTTTEAPSRRQRRVLALAIIYGPCSMISIFFPTIFLPALQFSGMFRQLLFGVLPLLMVYKIRREESHYNHHHHNHHHHRLKVVSSRNNHHLPQPETKKLGVVSSFCKGGWNIIVSSLFPSSGSSICCFYGGGGGETKATLPTASSSSFRLFLADLQLLVIAIATLFSISIELKQMFLKIIFLLASSSSYHNNNQIIIETKS